MEERKFDDFFEAWWFLCKHPIFKDEGSIPVPVKNESDKPTVISMEQIRSDYAELNTSSEKLKYSLFNRLCEIHVVKVNPETNEEVDEEEINAQTRIWLYVWDKPYGCEVNEFVLDFFVHGDTYEDAIKNLAREVLKKFGDYKQED